jgi:hypothetical protein
MPGFDRRTAQKSIPHAKNAKALREAKTDFKELFLASLRPLREALLAF